MVYAQADLDEDLLTEIDLFKVHQFGKQFIPDNELDALDQAMNLISDLKSEKKQEGHRHFKPEKQLVLNYASWLSLYRKGELMLKEYHKSILPRIKEVISVQETIDLDNGQGDSITGVIDLIARLDNDEVYVLDHKTASSMNYYDEDSVRESPQLALYALAKGIQKAGFIVMVKSIKKDRIKVCASCDNKEPSRAKTCDAEIKGKRCHGEWIETLTPRAEINILLDTVNPNVEESTLEVFNEVNKAISAGIFIKNLSTCGDVYGGRCAYFDLCHNNKLDNLVTIEENKNVQ
jgi:hypothetical protein